MTFDWTKVPGYREDLTAEEKVALLKGFEFEAPKPDGNTVPKATFDHTASELAAVKKELKARMTEDERKEAERLAAEKALKDELETLRKERAESQFRTRLLEAKYSAEDADAMAKAYSAGDMDTFLGAISKVRENSEKALRMEIMSSTPRPGAGEGSRVTDKATEMAIGIAKEAAQTKQVSSDALSHYR